MSKKGAFDRASDVFPAVGAGFPAWEDAAVGRRTASVAVVIVAAVEAVAIDDVLVRDAVVDVTAVSHAHALAALGDVVDAVATVVAAVVVVGVVEDLEVLVGDEAVVVVVVHHVCSNSRFRVVESHALHDVTRFVNGSHVAYRFLFGK